MSNLYATGYNGTVRDLAGLLGWSQWQHLDPENQRRVLWILDASIVAGKPLGIGSIWRSEAAADAMFKARHYVVPAGTPRAIVAFGKHWLLIPGQAPSAPGVFSYHCETTVGAPLPFVRRSLAVDFIGNLVFLRDNAAKAGLFQFGQVNSEPWHAQPSEIPHSRRRYVLATHNPLKPWPLPGMPTPAPTRVIAPTPVLRHRVDGVSYPDGKTKNTVGETRDLQTTCNFWGWKDTLNRTLVIDDQFGPRTAEAVMTMQRAFKIEVDGLYGNQSRGALQGFLDWAVSGTNVAGVIAPEPGREVVPNVPDPEGLNQ